MTPFPVDGNKVVGREREIASVVGPLCTLLDLLADSMELANAEVGYLAVRRLQTPRKPYNFLEAHRASGGVALTYAPPTTDTANNQQ